MLLRQDQKDSSVTLSTGEEKGIGSALIMPSAEKSGSLVKCRHLTRAH